MKFDLAYFEGAAKGAQSLDFNGWLMGDAGVCLLAEVLKKNETVTWLNLEYNNIGPEGAKVLAEALKCNSTLTDLHMCGNVIYGCGSHDIAVALRTNRSLVRIFGVFLEKMVEEEFHLSKEQLKYTPGNSGLICAVRKRVDGVRLRYEFLILKHLLDQCRLIDLPCRIDDPVRRVVHLAVNVTDLPFHLIVSFLSC